VLQHNCIPIGVCGSRPIPCFFIFNYDKNRAASGHAAVCLNIGLNRAALAQQRRDLILGWNRCR
jgi:hypothetical protein